MKKKWLWMVLVLCVVFTMTACGAVEETNKPAEDSQSQPAQQKEPQVKPQVEPQVKPQEEPKEPVELVLFTPGSTPEEEVKEKFSDPIEAALPHIKIKYIRNATGTRLDDLIAAGQVIDVFYESLNYFYTMQDYGFAFDMTPLLEKHNVDLDSFEPTMMNYARTMSNDGIYGLPLWSENVILFYNQDIFDSFGVSYPQNGMTWDELHDLSKRLTRVEDGRQYFGFAASPGHIIRTNQYSLTFNDPETDKATIMQEDRWKDIYEAYFVIPASDEGYRNAILTDESLGGKIPYRNQFLKDKTVAIFAYLNQLDRIASGDILNWDMASLPVFSDLPNIGSQAYPYFWGVTDQSEYKDEAIEVIKYLTSAEYQTQQVRGTTMTSLKDQSIKQQYGQDSAYKDKNLSAVYFNDYAPMPKMSFYQVNGRKPFEAAIHEAASGSTDLNTLFRRVEEESNQAVEAAKKGN